MNEDMNLDVNWDDISFILSGKHRKRLLELLGKPKNSYTAYGRNKSSFQSGK